MTELVPTVAETLAQHAAARVVDGVKIDVAEKMYNARYVGQYDLPNREGPFLVFWTDNPNRALGHDNYFGLFRHPLTDQVYITSAASIREATYSAMQLKDGSFICSRYRHDYQTGPDGEMIDGGLAYIRCAGNGAPYTMKVVDGYEVFAPYLPVIDVDYEIVDPSAPQLTDQSHD